MAINEKLELVYKKLQQLLQQYDQLQKENQQLQAKITKSEEQRKTLSTQLFSMQQKLDVLKIASGQFEESEKKDIEKRINQYIKNIDICIDALMKAEK